MLPPEFSDLLMEEYMGDVEDPQTLQAQFRELMEDFMFVVPALQVAHFQREYILRRPRAGGAQSCECQMTSLVYRPHPCLHQLSDARHLRTLAPVIPYV